MLPRFRAVCFNTFVFKKRLYLDFASATPLDPKVARVFCAALREYGNPSAVHEEGRRARARIDDARALLARTLSVRPETLLFTASGTEANNSALIGVFEALSESGIAPKDMHIIISSFEHPSILNPAFLLERRGASVTRVSPDAHGIVTPESIIRALTEKTVLVSVCAVQGEIGTLQPIKEIARALETVRSAAAPRKELPHVPFPLLHSDASQGFLFVDVSPERLGADMVTYDAQKVMGPKGVGALYRRSVVPLAPVLRGGGQERGLRPGTENTPAIVAMAEAFRSAHSKRRARAAQARTVQEKFFNLIAEEIPHALITGSLTARMPNNVHLSIPGVDGDYLAVLLDKEGVAVSPRSACIASGELSASVTAVVPEDAVRGTVRFTFGPNASVGDASRAVRALKKVLPLAGLSPETTKKPPRS